jgi:hypothetical protein
MTYGTCTAVLGLLIILVYSIYRRLSRISVADVPGPSPESFILGMRTS